MGWSRSLAENVVANLIASAITGTGAAVLGKTNQLPTTSVVLLGVGGFATSLLVLIFMSLRLNKRTRAEAALPLLREVGIHMLQNRPFRVDPLGRLGENIVWWRDRTAQELRDAGARDIDVSRFSHLGTL